MEPLLYYYLALAKVAPTSTDGTASETIGKRSKPLAWLKPSHRSATINLLAAAVALGAMGMTSQASALVKHGDRGTDVTALQERLQELGYFKANVTGYFGGITKEAVRQFQQERGLTPDGVVGTQTQAALDEQSAEQSAEKEAGSESSERILRLGDRGESVLALQKRLAYAGYFPGEKEIFDEETKEAVRQFQQAKGLKVDGIVGPQTLATLPKVGRSEPALSQQAPSREEEKPAITHSKPKSEPEEARLWYEDESAPLQPFVR